MAGPDRLRIVGGAVHDPANGVDGEVRDVCIEDGRIVASISRVPRRSTPGEWSSCPAEWTFTPISQAPPAITRAGSCPEEHGRRPGPAPALLDGEGPARSGTGGTVPTTFTTGTATRGSATPRCSMRPSRR